MKKNILVGQSGGPTAVINASLYGIIKEAAAHSEQIGSVYGMINGIEGFLSGHIMDLSKELSDEDLELLRLTPAAYLGSCRYKLPENLDASVYTLLFEKFEQLNIGAVFYIGGNDSMDTADKLSRWAAHNNKEISFIGVPKPSIMIFLLQTILPDTAALPAMLPLQSVRSYWTPPFTSSQL